MRPLTTVIYLLTFLTLFLFNTKTAKSQVIEADSLALVALYDSTNGPGWLIPWDVDTTINTFFGVTLSSDGSRVLSLNLSNNELVGPIPDEIGSLTKLTTLDLSDNNLSGAVPSSIGSLDTLIIMNLSNNQLNDTLPDEITNLRFLRRLRLNNNALEGAIPGAIGNLDSLRVLDLANNLFQSEIPSSISNIDSLEILDLNSNDLSGEIITELGDLTVLRNLDLSKNRFNGSIPSNLGSIDSLEVLNLGDNQFLSGEIPDELGDLSILRELNLSGNQLQGTIPVGLGRLELLEAIDLSNNQLEGEIPDTLKTILPLEDINLSNNQFGDTISTDLQLLTNLRSLNLANNRFKVFEDLSSLMGFTVLPIVDVSGNELDFEDLEINISILPDSALYASQALVDTDTTIAIPLGGSGVINTSVGGNNNRYRWLRNDVVLADFVVDSFFVITDFQVVDEGVYQCEIVNDIVPGLTLDRRPIEVVRAVSQADRQALIRLYEETEGPDWLIQWDTSEVVNEWQGITIDGGRVVGLNLANNQLLGTIPPELGNLSELSELRLNNNRLSDSIPEEISMLSQLKVLTLNRNSLVGEVPEVLGDLSNLLVMDLSNNNLTGAIPNGILDLTSLVQLDLSNNSLDGKIPSQINRLRELRELNLSDNRFDGTIPSNIKNISDLVILDLSSNLLGGAIPSTIGDLGELSILDLSSNDFRNGIPESFGLLDQLSELDLSQNDSLMGFIPDSFNDLINLRILNLSNTGISGDVSDGFKDLLELRELFLADNHLTGLPDLSMLGNLNLLLVDGNELTFEDIEPNISLINQANFSFTNQLLERVGIGDTAEVGGEINLVVNIGGENNIYEWSKDGEILNLSDTSVIVTDSLLVLKHVDIDEVGTYTCSVSNTVVDSAGFNLIYKYVFQVEVAPLPPIILGPKDYCIGDSVVTLTVVDNFAPETYWFGDLALTDTLGQGTNLRTTIVVAEDTIVAVNKAGNLTSDTTMSIVRIKPVITVVGDTLFASTGGESYQWFVNSIAIDGANSSMYINQGPVKVGFFKVRITKNGCSSTSFSDDTFASVTSSQAFNEEKLLIYPNPTNGADYLNVKLPSNTNGRFDLKIIDIQGKMVSHFTALNDEREMTHEVYIGGLPQGSFVVLIETSHSIYKDLLLR